MQNPVATNSSITKIINTDKLLKYITKSENGMKIVQMKLVKCQEQSMSEISTNETFLNQRKK